MPCPVVRLDVDGATVLSNDPDHAAVRSDIDLISLVRNYDAPAQLVFSARDQWTPALFGAGKTVNCWIDGELAFVGRTSLGQLRGQVGQALSTDFNCLDFGSINRPALDDAGNTAWVLPKPPPTPPTLRTVAEAFCAFNLTRLTEMGISAPAGAAVIFSPATAGDIGCLPVGFDNVTIDEAMRKIAQAAPGVRVFLDPNGGTPKYHFVQLFATHESTLTLDQQVTDALRIERSLEGRSGAVRCNQRIEEVDNNDLTFSGFALAPAWDPTLEAQWTQDYATTVNAGGSPDPLSLVFRLFSFAGLGSNIPPAGSDIRVEVAVPNGSNATLWTQIPVASIDMQARTLITALPAIAMVVQSSMQRLARVPGVATAGQARLSYTVKNSGSVTVRGLRYPAQDGTFAGTVYTLDPVGAAYEKLIDVPDGINQASYAQAAWAVYSEPLIKGEIVLQNELPSDFYRLDRRISIARTGGTTGYESVKAPLMEINFQMAEGPTLTLGFSTERTLQGVA